jgi:hypothetical protein
MAALYFMGVHENGAEHVRCRVYGDEVTDEDRARAEFVDRLGAEGVVDCPAIDPWVEKLQEKGWLAATPELEPHPELKGRKIGRWKLTHKGRQEWQNMKDGV